MKSRPLYRPIAPDPTARHHLIVTDGHPIPADVATRFAATAVEIWTHPDPLPDLAGRLASETTGLRLYVVGDEAFLWDAYRVGEAAGLGGDEIALHPPTSARRRVQCLHCKIIIEAVSEPTVACPGCGLSLLVRDHFSRRLGAFQGVAQHGVTRGEGLAP
jgi:predicted RNA-binding Zn-ribbon protein involved in translation (DUF1610 family)